MPNENRPRLMVLGAGRDQVPIIRQAQKMGFETIVVSIDGDYPGFRVADKFYKIDVRDGERILSIARKERICAVVTDQTDISVPAVAFVADNMDLPSIGYECALRFTNKHLMRQHCQKIGIRVPRHGLAGSLSTARKLSRELGFPLVVKPVDNTGSRGVAKVNCIEELETKYSRAAERSACGEVILEEFFAGDEVVAAALVSECQVTNLGLGDRSYFDFPDMFIPKQTLFPSLLEADLAERVLAMNAQLISGLGPKFGIAHSEWLVNKISGEICLVETAIRGGGVFISSDLIPLAYGVNANEFLIAHACGRDYRRIDPLSIQGRASGYVCFCLPKGIIKRVSGVDQVNALPGVHRAYLSKLEVGRQIALTKDKSSRFGPILIQGADRVALNRTIRDIRQTLVVEVETADGTRGIQW